MGLQGETECIRVRGVHRKAPRAGEGAWFSCAGCGDGACTLVKRVKLDVTWNVYRKGTHLAPGKRRYEFTTEQKLIITTELGKDRGFTVTYLLEKLTEAGLLRGCTAEDLRRLIHRIQTETSRIEGNSMEVGDLYASQQFFESGVDYGDDDLLALVPLTDGGPHIIIDGPGVDVAAITGQSNPRKLADGTAFSFVLPLASVKLAHLPAGRKPLQYRDEEATAHTKETKSHRKEAKSHKKEA